MKTSVHGWMPALGMAGALALGISEAESQTAAGSPATVILRHGVYRIVTQWDSNQTLLSRTHETQSLQFSRQAERVPVSAGIAFGFDFKVTGLPQGDWVTVTCDAERPAPAEGTSKPRKKASNQRIFKTRSGELQRWYGVSLDGSANRIEGKWRLLCMTGSTVLVSMDFELHRPS